MNVSSPWSRPRFAALAAWIALALSVPASAQQRRGVQLPEGVAERKVVIWSEGTRMAGDLYYPEAMAEGDKLPAIVLSHGWGGTKAGLVRYASAFAEAGYMALAFDYRGWGESDSRLVVHGEIPEPDENGETMVKAQFIRTVVDPFDQVIDIRAAVDFITGEPGVDVERIGYWGSSYSGGHAVWVAVNEPRVKCSVGQVAAADSLDLAQTSWKDMNIAEVAHKRAIDRARGEVQPVPQGTDKAPNLNGWALLEKVVRYRPALDAGRITIPLLIIDAENEELFDRHKAGELAVKSAQANGAPAEYHVVPDITHYGIYRGQPAADATRRAIEWYDRHLK